MKPLLEATGLRVVRDGVTIIDDISCTVRPGEIVAVVGPNGAGKSTLLHALCGLLPLSAGTVQVAGRSLAACSGSERARLLGWVPQQSALHAHLSVRDVVAMGRFPHRGARPGLAVADRQAIDKALARCDLTALALRSFPTLSGGERARVLIARALATEAPVLCLDEPTASLDVGHALDCYALCRELADSGHGVMIVLHQIADVVRHTDRCLLLDAGRTICFDASDQAITAQRIRTIYGVDMRSDTAPSFHRPGGGDTGATA